MKPVKLTFNGINTYIEKQTIDFYNFNSSIFGIFGKTGSGKSTILDAITLALYDNSTRGKYELINNLAQKIEIEFIFEKSGELYKIIRKYSKNNKTDAFFYKMKNRETEKEQITSGTTSVTKEVINIIGLDFEDFTKVVFLPQGKFADFLSMPPKNRIKIFEKLFDLKEFGENLKRKVNEKTQQENEILNHINGQLEQLNEISAQSVIKEEKELKQIKKEIIKLKKEMKKLEKSGEKAKQYIEIIQEKKEIENNKTSLEKERSSIANHREQLKIFNDATKIQNEYFSLKTKKEELTKINKEKNSLKLKIDRYINILKELDEKQITFNNQYGQKIKNIITNEKEIKEIIQKKKDSIEKEKKLGELLKEKNIIEEQQKAVSVKIENIDETIKKKQAELIKLTENEKEFQLSKNERNKHEILSSNIELIKELTENKNNINDKLNKLTYEINKINKKIKDTVKNSSYQSIKETDFTLLPSKISLEIEKEENKKEKLEKIKEELQKKEKAVELAVTLKEGKPCPVCGSIHHPTPVSHPKIEQEIKKAESQIGNLKETIDSLKTLDKEIKPLVDELKEKLIANKSNLNQKDNNNKKLKKITDKLSKVNIVNYTLSELEKELNYLKNKVEKQKQINTEINKVKEEKDKLTEELNQIKEDSVKIKIDLNKITNNINTINESVTQLKAEINNITNGENPEILLKEIYSTKENIENEKTNLENQIKNNRTELEKLNHKISSLKGKAQEIEKNIEKTSQNINKFKSKFNIENIDKYFDNTEKNRLEKTIKNWETNIHTTENNLKKINEKFIKFKDEHFTEEEVTVILSNIEEKEKEIEDKNIYMGNLENKIKTDQNNLENKNRLLQEKKQKKELLSQLKEIQKLVKGNKLVNFILQAILNNIVKGANDIIKNLLNNSLYLKINMANQKLNFSIDDRDSGGERDVKTLSGGEMFIVSFSLALALSKFIQQRKDSEFNFFFIDEGFGTLDDEKKNEIMEVLNRLKNNDILIGLITHVKEFKEFVNTYIQVNKTEGTSQITTKL